MCYSILTLFFISLLIILCHNTLATPRSTFVTEPPGNPYEVPQYLQGIQIFPSQVWRYYEISFDMNGNWCKMVCTYNLFVGEYICRIHTCEIAPFCCTALICTHANEQCFVPPVLVQQITHYITTYHIVVWYTIDFIYIWTTMGGLIVTYKVELITILEFDYSVLA